MRLLNYDETADLLGLRLSTLYSMVSRGQIPHVRLGPRLVRFDAEVLHAWLDARRVDVVTPASEEAG